MYRRSFLKFAAGGAAATAAAVLPSSAIAQSAQEWRLLALWPEGSPFFGHLRQFAETVRVLTDGSLKIAVAPRGSIAPAKLLAAVANGDAEMGHAVPYLWGETIPAAALLFIFPFGLTSTEKEAWLMHGGGQELVDRIYEAAGCKFLPLGGSGPQMGGWFKAPLRSAAGLEGLRIRIGGLGAKVMAAAGAAPEKLSPFGGKIQAALKAGELDAAETRTPAADLKDGYPRLAQTYHYPNWHEPSPTFDLFINRSRWRALSPALREAVTLAAHRADRRMMAANVAPNAKALETMVAKHGTRLTPFPREVMATLARHAAEVVRAEVSGDPLARTLYESMMDFRRTTDRWTNVTDRAFLEARALAAL